MSKKDDKTKKYNVNDTKNQETKKVKVSENLKKEGKNLKKEAKKLKKAEKKKNRKHPKLRMFIKIFIILCILLCLAAVGVFAAIFFGDTWDITEEDLIISMQNSSTYDSEGNLLHELVGEENRKIIPLSEMGEYIPKAFVAIEDERFYQHSGIDLYRTAGAIFTYIVNGGSSSFGGSTITQQLVKNLMEDDDDSVARKIREWSRAYKVEQMISKSQILELYLNEIFMGGPNVCGVESAAKYYFNKSANELSIAESAFLAGINHSPNRYNPFGESDNSEIIKSRTKTVLAKMLEVTDESGNTYITQEQYDEAIAEVDEGLAFEEGEFSTTSDLSFLEVEAIDEVIEDIMEQNNMDYDAAYNRVYNNGYKIYTTQDTEIQERMEEEYLKDKYIEAATSKNAEEGAHTQSGMVIIDHSNGQVVGCVGGLGDDSPTYGINRAVDINKQPGSSIKPLAAIAPGLENNIITAATVYDDSTTSFGDYTPRNSTGYLGLTTVRKAIAVSSNIVNIKILSNVGTTTAIDFLHEIGLTNFTYEDDAMLSLVLGGSTNGTSPLQMAAAYAAIANGGEYIEPTFYTKVEDTDGNVILETTQETKRVMSEGNAYILTSILTAPVTDSNGTARACAISGMDVAAKTGTTSNFYNYWLCGFTPYYAASTWYGYDYDESVQIGNQARTIWAAIMSDIHADLESARFERPSNIVTATICLDSGKVATDECTNTYTEVFVSGTVPDECDGHKIVDICSETGLLATEYCPETEKKAYLSTPEKEINASWKTNAGNKYEEITETCDKHTEETMGVTVENVIGLTESEARSKLSDLTITVEYVSDSTEENGVVVEQSVAAGTSLVKGDAITITVNKITTSVPSEPSEEDPDDSNAGNTGTNETDDNLPDTGDGNASTVE